MHLSIRWKLLLSISLPLLVTYTIMLVWDYQRVREGAIDQVKTWVLERAQSSANGINRTLENASQSAEYQAMLLGRSDDLSDRARMPFGMGRQNPWAAATHIAYEAPDHSLHFVTQRRGPFSAASNDQPLSDDPQLQALCQQMRADLKPHWSVTHVERQGRQMVVTYGQPIVQNQKVRGAVLIDINVNELVRYTRAGRRTAATTEPGEGPPDERRESATQPGPPPDGPMDESREPGRESFSALERARQRLNANLDRRASTTQPSTEPTSRFARQNDFGPGRGGPPGPPPNEDSNSTGTSLDPDANAIELIDRDGRPISMHPPSGGEPRMSVLQWADQHNLPDFTKAFHAAQDGESGIARVPGLAEMAGGFKQGETYWIALAPIKETGWVYSAAIPESQLIGGLLERLRDRALFLAAGLIVILMVAVVVAFRLSRPIEHMAGAVRQLAQGNLDARVTGVTSHDELGQLARAFNLMTGQLKAHVKALTEQTAAREKTESELRIARQIQTDLLPRTFPPFPDRAEFDLHAMNVPAAGVAGDFYDFFFVDNDWLTICIADVSGKGVPAALLMAVTRTIVRNLALAGLPLQKIVERANEMLLADTNNNMFVTMILAQYHPSSGRLRYVNAGHPRPFIFRADGPVESFGQVTSPLLGVCDVCEIGPIEEAETVLEVGQTLLLYTDGVTEARDMRGRMLRDAGTKTLIRRHENEDVARFCISLVDEVDRFQDHRPADDITILALRRKQ